MQGHAVNPLPGLLARLDSPEGHGAAGQAPSGDCVRSSQRAPSRYQSTPPKVAIPAVTHVRSRV